MKLLLDTHAWLWFTTDPPKLTPLAKAAIEDLKNEIFISPASYWELAIKFGLGKLKLSRPFAAFVQHAIQTTGSHILPIEPQHAAAVVNLPHHHRDPFDRLLIAQAMTEGCTLVSGDAALDAYGIPRLW